MIWISLGILLLLLCGCNQPQEDLPIRTCTDIPSPRACATCFVYNDEAYIFGGRDSHGTYLNDLWRYTPSTDTWTSLGTTPLTPRVNATACVIDEHIYIGLGYGGEASSYYTDSSYLRDWYCYEPQSGTFTSLCPYPNAATDKACSWAIHRNGNAEVYVGYGFRYNYTRDIFRYDLEHNTWDSIDTHVSYMGYPSRCFGATCATWHDRMYCGTGYRRHALNWWAELIPSSTSSNDAAWSACAAVPAPERVLAACTATEQAIYLTGGMRYGGVNTTGYVAEDIVRYAPDNDHWTRIGRLPQPLCNHLTFAVGNTVYFGIGETWLNDTLLLCSHLYCISDD